MKQKGSGGQKVGMKTAHLQNTNCRMNGRSAEIPGVARLLLWLTAWTITALCLLKGLLFFPFFPLGLLQAAGAPLHEPIARGTFLFAWIPYVMLTFLAYKARRGGAFFAIYLILCVLLFFNVLGCRATLEDVDRGLH